MREGRTGGEDTSFLGLEGDSEAAREDGEPTALSDMNARIFRGVVGPAVASRLPWSLLRLMILASVRDRPSIRWAMPPPGVEGARLGREDGASDVKENMSERSLTGRRCDDEAIDSAAEVVDDRAMSGREADDEGDAAWMGDWARVEGLEGEGDT